MFYTKRLCRSPSLVNMSWADLMSSLCVTMWRGVVIQVLAWVPSALAKSEKFYDFTGESASQYNITTATMIHIYESMEHDYVAGKRMSFKIIAQHMQND